MLAAGLDGIKNKILPPDSTDTNIYHLSAKERKKLKIDMLPGSLTESQEYLEKDGVLCATLGDHIVENLSRIAEQENDAYRLAVHQWELDRYLPTY
jgi:glutamine synthetase